MKILKFFLNLAVYLAIVVGVLFGVPKFLSWKLKTPYPMAAITSGSMWPTLKEKDIVFIKGIEGENISVGDIIVYQNRRSGGFTIHRVARIEGDTVITKGDGNFQEDAPIGRADIVGKALTWHGRVVRIPWLGAITVIAGLPR